MSEWIPDKEDHLLALCSKWNVKLSSSEAIAAFNWNSEMAGKAHATVNAYLTAYRTYSNANTTTNRIAKDDARKKAIAAMREFANSSVRYNPLIDVSARLEMGLRDAVRTSAQHPRPTSVPDVTIEPTAYHYQHRVRALNLHSARGTRPAGVHGIRFVWQAGGERPESGAALLRNQFSKRPAITVLYDETDRGKCAYYSACYENARGEQGPWAPIAEAYIA